MSHQKTKRDQISYDIMGTKQGKRHATIKTTIMEEKNVPCII